MEKLHSVIKGKQENQLRLRSSQWLLQMWKFWCCARSQYGFNLFGRWHQCF